MIKQITLFLKKQKKYFQLSQKSNGFTLIELLVAIAIASIILSGLLTFLNTILKSERQEQAKATTEQEIQSALDYIAQDLAQAVYIYDADGLNNNSTTDPTTSGIKNQIPPVAAASGCGSTTTCVPVLVFWKREPRQQILPVSSTSNCNSNPSSCNDTFVYSLVAYYLTKGDNSNGNWSNTARIRRFQIRDGVRNPINPTTADGTTANYITGEAPSNGFQQFDLTVSGSTLKQKMNSWKKADRGYAVDAQVLVDYIDQSTTEIRPNCSTNTQQVPSTLVGGFYACVDSSKTLAQVYLRGNALARINSVATYTSNQSTYFPTTSVQVKSRGLLGDQ